MAPISLIIYFTCYLSYYHSIIAFLALCITLIFCKNFILAYQIPLFIIIINLYKGLIPNPYIYSDFITYDEIPRDTHILNMSSYWASPFDYIFSLLLKLIFLLNITLYEGFILLLSLFVVILFNLIYRFRNNLHDAVFFLLCLSYTSSFQLIRYTFGVSVAYFLYLWKPAGFLSTTISYLVLIQFHFFSIINYTIFKLSYIKLLISICAIFILIYLGIENQLIDLLPDFGRFRGNLYSKINDLKYLIYILACCPIFLIKSPLPYFDPLKKMVIASIIFIFFNSSLSERMLVLPFNIFFGLILSYFIVDKCKIFYFLPFFVFTYRYLIL